MAVASEVFVHEIDRGRDVEAAVLVRPESEAFLAGTVPWPAEPPPDWKAPAAMAAVSAAVVGLSLLFWGEASAFGGLFAVGLLCLFATGGVALGRWSIRNSPSLPTAVLPGAVSEYSTPGRLGSQTIDAEYISPTTGLTNRVAFKSTTSEVGRLGLGPGAAVYVLYFDDNRSVVL